MTLEKLKQHNGKNGEKAYIAYKGNVYDLSSSPLWKDGIHQKLHEAGLDLTEVLEKAPHSEEVFARFTIVDTLDKESSSKRYWVIWYRKYHPHPMLVHFPIALHLFAAGLNILFLFYHEASYATAVFYSFFVATIMGVLAMFTGIFSWWINYQLAFTQIFVIKLSFSIITLLLGIVGISIYLYNPDVVYLTSLPSILYHAIIFLTGITVIVLAYNGGKITWPEEEESS